MDAADLFERKNELVMKRRRETAVYQEQDESMSFQPWEVVSLEQEM